MIDLILPYEIWYKIFQHLSFESLLSFKKAYPQFVKFLKDKKLINWMFFRNRKLIPVVHAERQLIIVILILPNNKINGSIETTNELLYYLSYFDLSLKVGLKTNSTILHYIVKNLITNLSDPLKFLKKYKTEMITYKNDSGSTPLHYLCGNHLYKLTQKMKIIELFKKEMIILSNNRGSIPYDWLKSYHSNDYTEEELKQIDKILYNK